MAIKKSSVSQKSKTAVKTTGKVVTSGYAFRLAVTGGAAKRRAQKDAIRSDAKRVSRGAKRVANTSTGKKVRATKIGTKVERTGSSAVAKTKSFAGSGPMDMARSTKKAVGRAKPKKGPRDWSPGAKRKALSKSKASMATRRTKTGWTEGRGGAPGKDKTVQGTKTFKAGKAVGKAATHVGANKGKYAAGAAVGVAGGAAATYAYKRRKARKATGASSATTYKRRTASGKTITVRKGKTGERVGNGLVHLGAYGSTRYTSKGAKNSSRTKGVGTVWAGSMAGSMAGAAIGAKIGGGTGVPAGQFVGNLAGGTAGRAVARKRGYVTRTKKRMAVRAVNNVKGRRK